MLNTSNISGGNFGPDRPGKLVYNEGMNYFLATRLTLLYPKGNRFIQLQYVL